MDDAARSCWTCGHEIVPSEPEHELDAQDQIPLVDWKEPEPPAVTVQREAVPASRGNTRSLALAGGVGVLACVTAIFAFQSMQPAASPQPVAIVTPPSSPAPAAPAPIVQSSPPPTWVGARQATWANDGSKTISFELDATNDVTVWMGRVRPLLIVRCLYRTTEVFVAIRSSASIEGQAGQHTVRLHIDDDPEEVQQWSDSVTGQELFAPNSVDLARRLASAQRMRFSFTPYNASTVTAEFAVQGFDKLAGLVGNTCGWKLTDPRAQLTRR
jgi:hypothetical protein